MVRWYDAGIGARVPGITKETSPTNERLPMVLENLSPLD